MNYIDTKKAIDTIVLNPQLIETFRVVNFTGKKNACVDWTKENPEVDAMVDNVKKAMPKGSDVCLLMATLVKTELGVSKIRYDNLCTIVGRLLSDIEDYDQFIQLVTTSLQMRDTLIRKTLDGLAKEMY